MGHSDPGRRVGRSAFKGSADGGVEWGKGLVLILVPGEGAQQRPETLSGPPRTCAWRRARARQRARVLRGALCAEFGEGRGGARGGGGSGGRTGGRRAERSAAVAEAAAEGGRQAGGGGAAGREERGAAATEEPQRSGAGPGAHQRQRQRQHLARGSGAGEAGEPGPGFWASSPLPRSLSTSLLASLP